MALLTDIDSLVEEFAGRLDSLNLTVDDQEAYSTMLCRLENQVGRDNPNYAIVVECVSYLSSFAARSASHAA